VGPFGKALRVADAVGTFAMVFILPEDISITSGSTRYHRNFMDIYISQQSRQYLSDLMEYHKVLKHRNSLLKKIKAEPKTGEIRHLDVWDEKMAELSLKLMQARDTFMTSIKPRVTELSQKLSSGNDAVGISYRPRLDILSFSDKAQVLEILQTHRTTDIKSGVSHLGPHRDMIDITVNGEPLRPFGSLGQKKTVMIAMKLAALELLSESRRESAILILDEAFAQLDRNRSEALLGLLSNYGQVFLGSAAPVNIDAGAKVFEIAGGKVSERN